MAFGQQNVTIALTPTGKIDSQYLNGADGSDQQVSWANNIPPISLQIGVDPTFSLDLADAINLFLIDPGSPAAELGFYDVSGVRAEDAGFTLSGTVLQNPVALANSGAFKVVAIRGLVSKLSSLISFQIQAGGPVIDSVAPSDPTGITADPGNNAGDILIGFDAPSDMGPSDAPASGVAHVDIYIDNAKISSPVTTPANSLAPPVTVNLGGISGTLNQDGRVFTLVAAGTGIVSTTSEQALLADLGTFSGYRKFTAKVNAYTSTSGGSIYSATLSEQVQANDLVVTPISYTSTYGESVIAADSLTQF